MKSTACVMFGLLACSASAHAEYGCQDGFIPVNQAGGQACVADYNLPYWGDQTPQSSQNEWLQSYAPVAVSDGVDGHWAAWDKLSKDEAIADALKKCRQNTGTDDCVLLTWAANAYLAVVKGDDGYYAYNGSSEWSASLKAKRLCSKRTKNCEVLGMYKSKAWRR